MRRRFWIRVFGRKIGFTLTEVLVVVIIIGILATLALPMLVKTLEKAKVGEAISNLNLIRTGQKVYYLEWGKWSENTGDLNIENPNDATSRYFDYDIANVTQPPDANTDFVATATRGGGDAVDAPSPYQGVVYYIKKGGTITSSDGMFAPQEE